MMSALVVLGAATLLENPSLRKSKTRLNPDPLQSLRPDLPFPARSSNSLHTAFVIKTNMNVDNNVTTKPSNKYFISTSCKVKTTCMNTIAAESGFS
jgi:hypothetical protein